MTEKSFLTAINEAYHEEFQRDPTVFILGENVAKQGGFMHDSKGLTAKFGISRVRDTPISETAIIGGAIGAAITGLRPICSLGHPDFLGVAMDEIWNQLTKMRYMLGGKAKLPVTITCYSGAGVSAAAQHSQSAEGLCMSIPGLKIVVPSTPFDAKGLLKSAIRDDNPVVYFIHKLILLKGIKGEVPEGEYTIPLGKADVKREGSDVTVVTFGLMVHRALAAADTLQKDKGISVEVVDIRSIVPLDKQTIFASVKKTGRLVIMDEEPKTGSVAAEIAALVAEEAFDYLDAPIKRVCAPDTPIPYSPVLEKFWMPDEDKLIKAINEITR
jgi:acetoin:2,6-dichlorophenolindophenol oxidoreductase subunit beta